MEYVLLKRYFWLINVVFITLLTFIVVDIFLTVLNTELEVSHKLPHSLSFDKMVKKEIKPLDFYRVIQERNLFDSTGSKFVEEGLPALPALEKREEEIVSVKRSQLNLRLKGTAVIKPGKSYAIIEDLSTREQEVYKLGDTLSNGAKITKILRNKIWLKLGEEEEELLEAEEETKVPGMKGRPLANNKPSSSETGETKKLLNQEEVSNALENMNKLMTEVRVVPNFSSGKPDGYKILKVKPSSLLANMGFRAGDVIKQINGQEINNPEEVFSMYQQLKDETAFTVDLERNKQRETFSFEVR